MEAVDGRRARSERTREAVLDAVIALIGEGEVPTTGEVAERAGISERSLFRHFESRDGLFDAAIDRIVTSLAPLVEPVGADGSAAARLERLVAVRSRLYEAMTPIRRVAPFYAARSELVARRMATTRGWFRDELEATFARELAERGPTGSRDVLDSLDLALSWAAWDHLRSSGATVADAQRVLTRVAQAVLISP